MRTRFLSLITLAMLSGLFIGCDAKQTENSATAEQKKEIIVYSARKEHLIKPLFDRYTEKTGVDIRYVTDKAGPLLARLVAEGEQSPADILMTVDAGNLWQAAEQGVFASLNSETLDTNVPAHLKDAQNRWFGLSVRARTLVYATDRIEEGEISSYEALAGEVLRGRLCLRTAKKVYNQSLVATLIATHGKEETQAMVEGWVANLALPPFSNDTKVMEAILAGQCDVGVVNTYYYGRLMKEKPESKLALFWPNQEGEGTSGRGVHINISGAGVTRASDNPEGAQALIEWLSSGEAQQIFASLNQELPVNPAVPPSEEVAAWGKFKADDINVAEAGRLQTEAIKLMDRAGYH